MKDTKRQQILKKVLLALVIVAAFLIGNWVPFKLSSSIILFVIAITIGIVIGCGLGSENGFNFLKKENKTKNDNK